MGSSNKIIRITTLSISERFRNKTENTNPASVLDGNIDQFIEEGIKIKRWKNYFKFCNISNFFVYFVYSNFINVGIETNKFNKLISENVSQDKNINSKLNTVKFKINLKELSLFLETNNPKISQKYFCPCQNIRVFINFLSVIKSDPKIKKINIVLNELDVTELNKLSFIIKPSNFKSILNNKIQKGRLFSEVDIFFNEDGNLGNYIAKGSIQDLEAKLVSDLVLINSNFSFFADKNDILLKNIFGNLGNIEIKDGDIKINRENGITITSNFNSQFDFDNKILNRYIKLLIILSLLKILRD